VVDAHQTTTYSVEDEFTNFFSPVNRSSECGSKTLARGAFRPTMLARSAAALGGPRGSIRPVFPSILGIPSQAANTRETLRKFLVYFPPDRYAAKTEAARKPVQKICANRRNLWMKTRHRLHGFSRIGATRRRWSVDQISLGPRRLRTSSRISRSSNPWLNKICAAAPSSSRNRPSRRCSVPMRS
jgi:hypothetical protein